MRINHNIASMIAAHTVAGSSRQLNDSLVKLSTGLRINNAGDDAAGLATSENLRAQVRGAVVAQRNADEATAMLQVGEGAAGQISDILQRMRELAVQGSNETLSANELAYLSTEYDSLAAEIDRVADTTEYNNNILLNGTYSGNLQIGTNGSAADQVAFAFTDISADNMTVDTGNNNLADATAAAAAITAIDAAIDLVNAERANKGALISRLRTVNDNMGVFEYNMQSAESKVRDVDFALETAKFTRAQILTQAGTAMLAQANTAPASVLSLFQ